MTDFLEPDLAAMDSRKRANLINSVTGYKSANLIGTIAADGGTNLAIFNSVVHIGAAPPLVGFVLRPVGEVPRHTYENILETRYYTINHVHESFVGRAHYTAAKFERGVSEFDICGLTPEFLEGFAAPFVGESRIKLGVEYAESIPIPLNGTILVVGAIRRVIVPADALSEDGSVDLNRVADVCVSGLDTYHSATRIAKFPYARPETVPDFEK